MKQLAGAMLCIAICVGCEFADPFYTGYARGDLWRLPLLKPYELITQEKADEIDGKIQWILQLQHIKIDNITEQVNVTKINIKDSVIYGYGQTYPTAFFVIDMKQGKEYYFKNKNEWEKSLTAQGLSISNLYDAWTLFYSFRDKGELQWRKW